MEACNFIKTEIPAHAFSVTLAYFLRTSILQEICEQLLLKKLEMNYRFNAKSGATENNFNYLPKK